MFFKIDRGLFKYDFIDHHAVLCVPVDADVKDIRKRYLKIARCLHPDSCAAESEAKKQLATDLFSKLVNPAYEKLSSDRTRGEYMIVLSQMSKRLEQESTVVELETDLARQLADHPNNQQLYKMAIAKIAETQYDSLSQVLQVIAQISELNLVYLMRHGGKLLATPPSSFQPKINSVAVTTNTADSATPQEESAVVQYLRRAQELMAKNQLGQAELELRDALKLEPNNSNCHSLIAVVYLKQNHIKMAKVHFERALQLDPQDKIALAGKSQIAQILGQNKSGANMTSSANTEGKETNKSGGGGLFGGLFGGKK